MSQLFSWRPDDDGLPPKQRALAMLVLMVGTLMAVLDTNIVNIALPTIADQLNVSSSVSVWVINVYQLVGAASILAFAALGYRIGRYRLYIGGLFFFTLASLGCALSPSIAWLVGCRAIQGLGAAAMMSIGPSLYRLIFPARLLGRALGLSALTVALGVAAGPAIGGLILAVASWPWLFIINIPAGAVLFFVAIKALPFEHGNQRAFDVPGAILSALALGAFVIMVDALSHTHEMWRIIGLLVLSIAAAVAFIIRQRRYSNPLLPLVIFSEPRFSMAAITSLFSFVAQGMTFISLPFLFQSVQDYTPLESALLFTPWPLAIMIAAPNAGRLADRIRPPILSTIGLALLSAGIVSLALLSESPSVIDIVWRTALCGLGFGFFQSPNNRELLGSLPPERSGSASGVMASVRTFGQSIGAALVALVLAGVVSASEHEVPADIALWIGGFAAVTACLLSASRIVLFKSREPVV
ncbi:DHA2 family efflux MFS transporter permease subunit [Phytohalomonas tamaricis]|uniref:DHA2 family efflux MFS transporter permease subunit n=1 Tax=Phytohalomonas tamaricis TaxID=2081032 RepID=UPI000D0B6C31|nr:DHA2 family efflux MFS transporter permease subunit [Phytohalomonas tamaricis]